MENLEAQFKATFEDKNFSRSERQSLRKVLKSEKLNAHELAVLRSKIFDIAREEITGENMFQVLTWLENANKLVLPQVNKDFENKAFFSPGNDCLNAIIGKIGRAINNIDICVFTISDDRISREIAMAHRKGVLIRLLTDNDKAYDKGSDIYRLAKKGISVKVDYTDKHMHHKFAIIDNKILLTGSYNWTRSAATSNEENILITNDTPSVKAYKKEFEKLWKQMKKIQI